MFLLIPASIRTPEFSSMLLVLAGALFYANQIAARLAGVGHSEWWAVTAGWQDLDQVQTSLYFNAALDGQLKVHTNRHSCSSHTVQLRLDLESGSTPGIFPKFDFGEMAVILLCDFEGGISPVGKNDALTPHHPLKVKPNIFLYFIVAMLLLISVYQCANIIYVT